jgi:MFS family permease
VRIASSDGSSIRPIVAERALPGGPVVATAPAGAPRGRKGRVAWTVRAPALSVFWLLCGAMGLVTVSLSALGTLVPLYAVREGAAASLVGVLVALPNVFPIALALTAGRLVDGGGAGRWLVVGTAGMVLAPLAVTLVTGLAALAVAQVVIGLFHLFATLSSQSFVAGLSNGRSFERNFSWYATSLAAGRMVGPLLAGVAIDLAGFRVAFAAVTLVALSTVALAVAARRAERAEAAAERADAAVASGSGERGPAGPSSAVTADAPDDEGFGVPTTFASPAPSRGAAAVREAPRGAAAVREAAANPGVQLAVLASSGVFVAIAVRQAFFPIYLQELAYPASTIGALLSLGAFAAVLVRPLMPLVSRAFGGPARTLVVAMGAVAVAIGLLGTVTGLAPLLLLTMLAGFGTGVGMPLSIVTVASHVDPRRRGLALGLRLSANRSAQLLAPVAIGALVGAAGFAVGFAAAGGLLALAALLAAARVPAFERAGSPAEDGRPGGAAQDV